LGHDLIRWPSVPIRPLLTVILDAPQFTRSTATMGKRKVEKPTSDCEPPPASSEQFSLLVSKYSYSLSAVDEPETKSSSAPVTPPETPKRKKPKASCVSAPNSRNPGYAPPSAYSHLPTPDLDALAHGLVLLFVGLNPGMESRIHLTNSEVWQLHLLSMLSPALQTSSGHYSIPLALRPYGIPLRSTSHCLNFIMWVLQT